MSEERTIAPTPESVSVRLRRLVLVARRAVVDGDIIAASIPFSTDGFSLCSLLLASRVNKRRPLRSCSISVAPRDRNTPAWTLWLLPSAGFERKEMRCVRSRSERGG